MNERPIYIATEDHAKLHLLLQSLGPAAKSGPLQKLREELDRAIVLEPAAVPPAVITMNSQFEIEDLGSGEIESYTLVFPEKANVEQRLLSVFAPIGTAVLGYSEGDEVEWATPGGLRKLKIRRVTRPEPATSAASEAPTANPQ